MQRTAFEYSTICVTYHQDWWEQMQKELQDMGLSGWELVAVLKEKPNPNGGSQWQITYFWKRKLSEEETLSKLRRLGRA